MATAVFLYVLLMLLLALNFAVFEATPVHENDCIFDESAAVKSSRSCTNRRCSLDTDICRGNRQCVCDGVCGYRCINVQNPSLCQPLPAPVNGSVVYRTDRSHGAIATYKCSPGYSLVNTTERICLGDGEWNMDATPTCLPSGEVCPRLVNVTDSFASNGSGCLPACTRKKDCPKKTQQICVCRGDYGMSCVDVFVQGYCPDIELTAGTVILSVTPRGNMYTSVATLGCDEGYEMDTETQEISCMVNGQWSAQPARCTAICSSPPRVENARHNSRSRTFSPGDTLTYTCSAGYHEYGNGEISTCLDDLSWTPVVMKCYAVSCGDPGYLRNGWRDGDLFTFLSRVIYHCNEGYEMRGFAYRTCLSSGRWNSAVPSCEAIQCPGLFAPDHGTAQGTQYEFEKQVYFACNYGYRLEGSLVRQCQADKTWSGDAVTCTVMMCPEPETPEHGFTIAPRREINAFVRYFCHNGYSLVGSQMARCTMEEAWSNPAPECKDPCPEESLLHGKVVYDPSGDTQHGTTRTFECSEGYSLVGTKLGGQSCNNGMWTSPLPNCQPTPCSRLDDLLNGEISYEPEVEQSVLRIPHNTTASYSCLYRYEQHGESVTVSCYYGNWSTGTPPICQPNPCPEESLLHGKVVYDPSGDPQHGTTRTFECSEGYSLVGTMLGGQSCNNGMWTSPLPNCQPNPCTEFKILNGTINSSKGQTLHLTCNTDLKPSVGDGQAHCHAGHWVPNDLQCIPNDAPFNIAYGKPAVQGDTLIEAITGNASLAVDGDRNSDFNHGSCIGARKAGDDLFWQVDLQGIYMIESVDIYSRQDCCDRGLSEAKIYVGRSENKTSRQCGTQKISIGTVESQQPIHVDCATDNLHGRYITIRLSSNKESKMNLCEVEVFGFRPVESKGCLLNSRKNVVYFVYALFAYYLFP